MYIFCSHSTKDAIVQNERANVTPIYFVLDLIAPTKYVAFDFLAPLAVTEKDMSSEEEEEHEYQNIMRMIEGGLERFPTLLDDRNSESSAANFKSANVPSKKMQSEFLSSNAEWKQLPANNNSKSMVSARCCGETVNRLVLPAPSSEENLMKLLAGSGPSRILWVHMPEVKEMLQVTKLTDAEIKLQEVSPNEIVNNDFMYLCFLFKLSYARITGLTRRDDHTNL